jgi:hypothetical protein
MLVATRWSHHAGKRHLTGESSAKIRTTGGKTSVDQVRAQLIPLRDCLAKLYSRVL